MVLELGLGYDMDAIRFKQPAHQVNSVQYLPGYNWLSLTNIIGLTVGSC